jgi:excisionase family DNA binding protein
MGSSCEPVDEVQSDRKLVYSVGEASELLGISRAFAYELVGRGALPVIRMGRRLLVPKVALLALVAQGAGEQQPPDVDFAASG